MFSVYKKLGKLKNEDVALSGGENPASYEPLQTSSPKQVIAFKRKKGEESIIYIANVTDKEVEVSLNLDGDFQDYMNKNQTFTIKKNQKIKMLPWEYHILK